MARPAVMEACVTTGRVNPKESLLLSRSVILLFFCVIDMRANVRRFVDGI